MIELFGKFYSFNRDNLKAAVMRLVKGDELTINYKTKEAWINKDRAYPQAIDFNIAYIWFLSGIVGQDSGNFETGEEHYTYINR